MATVRDAMDGSTTQPKAREQGSTTSATGGPQKKHAPETSPPPGRVLLLHLDVFSANDGQTLAVAESLQAGGWDVCISCRISSRLGAEAERRHIPVLHLADNASCGFGAAWSLLRKLKQSGGKDMPTTLVHACDPAASCLASRLWRLNKKLRIMHTRRVPVMEPNAKAMHCYQTPPAKVVTDSLASKIALRLSGLEPHLLHTIQCGLDPSAYAPRENRADGRFIFAMTGDFMPQRGHAELFAAIPFLDAALMTPSWEIRILGSGPLFSALLTEAETKGVLRHLSFLSGPAPWKELRHCDALVLPAPEGESYMPLILEGWAVNVPLITVNRLDHAEILTDGVNCLLIQPGNTEQLAASMARLATDPALCARLAEGGRASLARFSLKTMTTEYRHLYRETLA